MPDNSKITLKQLKDAMNMVKAYIDEQIQGISPNPPEVPCTGIVLNKDTLSFTTNDPQTLSVVVNPTNTTDKVAWSVNPTGIVTVVDGLVTPVTNGSCTITAACGTQSATCAVTVNGLVADEPTDKSVTNISIDPEKIIGLNGTTSLTASITPSDATNKEVTWSANNSNVKLTPNGLTCQVQAMEVGTSTITVTSNDTTNGTISSNCIVTISENAADNYTMLCGNLDYTGTDNGAVANTNPDVAPMIFKRDFNETDHTTICSNKTIRRICIRIDKAGKLTIGKVDLTQYKMNTDVTIIDAVQYDVTPGLNTLDVNISCGAHESLAFSTVNDTGVPRFSYTQLTTEQINGFPILKHSDFKTGTITSPTLALLGAIYI